MTDLPEINDEMVHVFLRAAVAAGAGAYISGGQGRLEVNDDHVRAGLTAALVASGWRPPTSRCAATAEPILINGAQVGECEPHACVLSRDHRGEWHPCRCGMKFKPATALEPSLPLPVADGREVEQGQERSEEQKHG